MAGETTMKSHPILTSGGMAIDAAGQPADMPRDLASSISHELFNVLTLLHAAMDQVDAIGTENDADPEHITDARSRSESLMLMGGEKVRTMIKQLSPYV